MNNQIPTSEVIEILAERDGWKLSVPHFGHDGRWRRTAHTGDDIWKRHKQWPDSEPTDVIDDWSRLPDYLNSRDTLAPVLAKFTPEEWDILHFLCAPALRECGPRAIDVFRHLLTLPPQTLAPMVALAIKEAKGR